MEKSNVDRISISIRYGILIFIICGACITGGIFLSSSRAQDGGGDSSVGQIKPLPNIETEVAKSLIQNENEKNSTIKSSGNLWREVNESEIPEKIQASAKPKKFRSLKLDEPNLERILAEAPLEFTAEAASKTTILYLPLPDGMFGRFKIKESPVMSEELSARFPAIKSYNGQGVDDSNATMRLSWTPKGLNAFVITKNGSFMVTPYAENNREYYLSYFTKDSEDGAFECLSYNTDNTENVESKSTDGEQAVNFTGGTLRQYRMIFSGTAQFYAFSGGTDADAATTINILINNVNLIYEREMTIRFIFQNVGYDRQGTVFPANQNPFQMADMHQAILDNFFGNGSYDVGHVLGFNSTEGGFGLFSGVCNSPVKAKGATVVSPNLFRSTIILSHELGHQLNARHTFTPVTGSCLPQSDPLGRVEPGSGSTIMSYAGICNPEDLQIFSDSYFHISSLLKIATHVDNVFPACGTRTATGNSPPTILGATGVNAMIPANTPFTLTGSATDPNGDPITYNWEQTDAGNGLPILRSYIPTTFPSRTFPSLPFILNNGNMPPLFINGFLTGESLPNSTRTLNFTLSTRDNRTTGGTSAGSLQVFVRGDAGPFIVTQPNSSVIWNSGSQQTVNWNIAGTNLSPINTANVRILLSTNGGQTFPIELAANTPNDGSQVVLLPSVQTTTARIKVEAVGNIYFDISDTNFTINQGSAAGNVQFNSPTYTANENAGIVSVTLSRTGGTTAFSVNYAVSGGSATVGADYTLSGNTLNFGTNETSKTFTVSILEDTAIEGNETINFVLSNPTGGGTLGIPVTTTLTIVDNDFAPPGRKLFDFDGDGKTDISIFRPSNGQWWINRSSNGQTFAAQFGQSTDKLAPADFTGDGKTDIAFFRPSTGFWFVLRSEDNSFFSFPFGTNGDIPAPADYDGDGKADAAIYRPSTATWFISRSSGGTTIQQFGAIGDVPTVADYDGDSKADLAIYRPSLGQWWLLRSTAGIVVFQFGNSSDKPVQGDYTGDGKADVAFFRPATNEWFVLRSENNSFYSFPFGASGDISSPGDYDGDGKTDAAIFRPSTNTWFAQRSTSGTLIQGFGTAGDKPIPNVFVP